MGFPRKYNLHRPGTEDGKRVVSYDPENRDHVHVNETEKIYGDKTPSYIVIPYVNIYIPTVLPWAKIIMTIRNPVDRFKSHVCQVGQCFDHISVQAGNHAIAAAKEVVLVINKFTSCGLPNVKKKKKKKKRKEKKERKKKERKKKER